MAECQMIEWGLKLLLIEDKKYIFERIENKPLGWVIRHAEKEGLRVDFLQLLDELLGYRNKMVHEFLYDFAILNQILKGKKYTKPYRILSNALHIADNAYIVLNFLRENKYQFWIKKKKIRSVAKVNIGIEKFFNYQA